MSKAVRTRLSVEDRRAQLLELGLRLFAKRAYDEVSIDDIARAAGVSKGLLYHYFGGKRAFYVACVQSAAEQLVELTRVDERLPEPARARAGLEAYFAFAKEHETAYLALMRSGIGTDPEVAAVVDRTRARIVDRIVESMGLSPEHRVFRAAARSWVGQVEAACLHWMEHDGELHVAEIVTLLLGGLYGTLLAAKALDPDAPFDPGPPPAV